MNSVRNHSSLFTLMSEKIVNPLPFALYYRGSSCSSYTCFTTVNYNSNNKGEMHVN